MILRWMFLGYLLGVAALAHAHVHAVDAVLDGQDAVSLTSYISVLEDARSELTLDDMRSAETEQRFSLPLQSANAINMGYTRSAYWLRLTLRNDSAQPVQRLLEIAYPLLSQVELHQQQANGSFHSVHTGLSRPFDTRPYANRAFVFPLTLAAHTEHRVWMRLASDNAMLVPARLWVPEAFARHAHDEYLWHAWYFGMATAMVLFNLLLFVVMRERIYLLYVGFVALMALTLSAQSGLAKQYLWPDSVLWSNIALYVGYSLTMALFVAFSRAMLDSAHRLPRWDRWLDRLTMLLALLPMLFPFVFQPLVPLAAALYGLSALLMLGTGLHGAVQRQRSAYFFLAAFSMTVLGGLLIPLRALGLVPTNIITMNGLQAGSALEMVLLAIALADRFNQVRREKEEAQQAALAAHQLARAAEQNVIENLRTSERLLEARVQERTAELSATIEGLEKTRFELVQAEKMAALGSLVAGVAHELNTPIGVVVTTASSLEASTVELQRCLDRGEIRKSTLDGYVRETSEMARLIVRSSYRAGELIASFKQVAVDQTSEQRRVFELHDLVEDHVAAMRPSFVQWPWEVHASIAPGIHCHSYPGPLGQVIVNMVQNAAAHAFVGRDHGVLQIRAVLQGGMVEMVFADDGHGMEPEVLAHAFEPFFTTRLGRGGSGLGLSISHNIATAVLGGSLSVSSTPGQGARFVLRFPLNAPSS